MPACKKFDERLVLYAYDELPEEEVRSLQEHLAQCLKCRTALAELQQMQTALPRQAALDPDETLLRPMRQAVLQQIRQNQLPTPGRAGTAWRPFGFLHPAAALQTGFALLLLAFGFLFGREFSPAAPNQQQLIESMLTGSRPVRAAQSAVDPFLTGVQKVKFNPQTGEVAIYYNTVNEIALRGDLRTPSVQKMLRYALLQDENSTVRLHAVKALQVAARRKEPIGSDLLQALTYLLEKEQNQGVKLQALKLLQYLPLSEAIKTIVARVLVYDKNAAVRLEAFHILTGQTRAEGDSRLYLELARQDTSSAIRYRAERLLAQKNDSTSAESKRTEHFEISREE